jgi:hypothetical protein
MFAKIDSEQLIGAPEGLGLVLDKEIGRFHKAGPVPSPVLRQGAIRD